MVSVGGKLYRVAPEHLRLATEREGVVFDMNHPAMGQDPMEMLKAGELMDLTNTPIPTQAQLEAYGRELQESQLPDKVRRMRINGKQSRPEHPAAMDDRSMVRTDREPKRA